MKKAVYFYLLTNIFNAFAYESVQSLENTVASYYGREKIDELETYLEEQEHLENPFAYLYHGSLWLDGIFGERKAGLANFYFLKGAEIARKTRSKDSLALAQNLKAIADSFYSGDGLPESILLARDYYLASAKLNYGPAIFNLAMVYKEQGDLTSAKHWLNKYISLKDSELKEEAKSLLAQVQSIF